MNLADLLTRQAEMRPDALAIIHGDYQLSYGETERMVWGLCRHFHEVGLREGDVVGLHLGDPLLLMATVFALARSGMVQLTLPSGLGMHSASEFLLSRTGACAVIDDDAAGDWGSRLRVFLDPSGARNIRDHADARLRAERPSALFMYSSSSGTTGAPKVFGIAHEAALASTRAEIDGVGYLVGERYLSAVSPAFPAPRRRYMNCLAAGATAVLPSDEGGLNGLVELIDRHDVRHFSCVPVQAFEMAAAVPPGGALRFPRMRCLRLSAGPSESSLHQLIRQRLTPNVMVSYGCNELGPLTVARPRALAQFPNTVGYPLEGVSVEVVDAADRVLAQGMVGHIRLRADGMPQSYLHDETATAKAFRNGWFYPGDLGKWAEGGLLHMGRADDMMVMNGINIYPAEIEQALMLHPAVRDAAALPLYHPVAGDEPVCAVALKAGERASARDLMAYALDKLGVKCPNRIQILDSIPRNHLGKVRRATLKQSILSRIECPNGKLLGQSARGHDPEGTPLAQLTLTAVVAFAPPSAPDFPGIDAWLDGVFQLGTSSLSVDEVSDRPEAERLANAWLKRALRLSRMLMHAAGIPVFDLPRVIACRPDSSKEGSWQARVAFAKVEELPNATYGRALKEAMDLNAWAMTRPVNPETLQICYGFVERHITPALRPGWLTGASTFQILKAAYRKSIPFTHLGAGAFQLGWGSKAQRIQRSVTGRDTAIGANLCNDKATTANLLRRAGLPAPVHYVVNGLQAAQGAAGLLGWPVVVKPADCERGEGVQVDVSDESQLKAAFEVAHELSRSKKVIVERQVDGVCHRLFIAQGKLLYGVKRMPMSIEGDGSTDIAGLINLEVARQLRLPPMERSGIRPLDDLAREAIARAGYAASSVPGKGVRVPLRRIESTEWGGIDEDVSNQVHPENLRIALAASHLFGLSVAGIDIITPDIAQPWFENRAIINEVNFAPLLGGGEISRSHLPMFLDSLMGGTGMIRVEVFVGGEAAWTAANECWRRLLRSGVKAFLSGDRMTRLPSGEEWYMPFVGLYRRTRALILSPDVQAIVLVVRDNEFLSTGLPLEGVHSVSVVDRHLTAVHSEDELLSAEHVQMVLQLLQGWPQGIGAS